MKSVLTLPVLFAAVLGASSQAAVGQLQAHPVSVGFDSVDAPSAFPAPGFAGGFRQQILIDATRLTGLQGRSIRGLWLRRDLHEQGALAGGQVDLTIHVSAARDVPARAESAFVRNVSGPRVQAFSGRIQVPASPALGTNAQAWSPDNAVRIVFSTPFSYAGGPLCLDLEGRPVPGVAPVFWALDHERGMHSGRSVAFGASCSAFANTQKQTLFANDLRLQIGSSLRVSARGRPGSIPLFLLGLSAIPAGVDLTNMGATDCRQYVQYFAVVPLLYSTPRVAGDPGSLLFDTQIPFDPQLSGAKVFVQTADDEGALPRSSQTNPAALTTSNGLELQIAGAGPNLGLAIVTSPRVAAGTPMPAIGEVDVSMGPVMRLLH